MAAIASRLSLLAVLVGLLLTLAVARASAVNAVLFRPGGAATIAGRLLDSGLITECNVTLSGSFVAGTSAIEGVRIGSASGMTSECSETETFSHRITRVLSLPWPLRLQKLNGLNPRYAVASRITEATMQFGAFAIEIGSTHREAEFGLCLFGGESEPFSFRVPLRLIRATEYTWGGATGRSSVRETTSVCTEFWGRSRFEGPYSLEPPVPTQTVIFTAGGEVIEGLTPSPVEFGVVATEGLARRTVTLTSAAGGSVEEIGVAAGRYFAVTDPNGCRGSVIAEGGRCTFNVLVAAPAEAGTALSDTLTARIAGRRFEVSLRAST